MLISKEVIHQLDKKCRNAEGQRQSCFVCIKRCMVPAVINISSAACNAAEKRMNTYTRCRQKELGRI